mmetsp:Transcript_20853/g.62748  ORF Transcript_20853/g.62748 Transcript_20853/m.62748 type:complete len:314 (-) Transcript_20853:3644-4585(-)
MCQLPTHVTESERFLRPGGDVVKDAAARLHLRSGLHNREVAFGVDDALDVLGTTQSLLYSCARLDHRGQHLPLERLVGHDPVGVVLHFLEGGGLQGDGVVQPRPRVPRQVLSVAVAAEDEGLRHKHALALAGVCHHLGVVEGVLAGGEGEGCAGHHARHDGLPQPRHQIRIDFPLVPICGVDGVDDEGVGGGYDALHQHSHADVSEVDAHLAHAQHGPLVVHARPHPLEGGEGLLPALVAGGQGDAGHLHLRLQLRLQLLRHRHLHDNLAALGQFGLGGGGGDSFDGLLQALCHVLVGLVLQSLLEGPEGHRH